MGSNINERMSNLLKQATRMDKYERWLDILWCIPNNRCSSTLKVVIPALERHYRTRSKQADGTRKIWIPDVTERCGMSPDTITTSLKKLDKVDAITYRSTYGNGKRATYIHFSPLFLKEPANFFTEEHTGKKGYSHGGTREPVKCPHCGEYHPLQKRSTFICSGCGTPIDELTTVKMIPNHPPTEGDYPALPSMQEIDEAYVYGESCDVPDDIYDSLTAQGKDVLTLPSPEIAKFISMPRYQREGLEEADWEAVEAEIARMRGMVHHG